MKRMRTLLLYALGIVGFIFLSYILEDGLIIGMYKELSSQSNITSSDSIKISDVTGKATSVNGYMEFKLTNNSKNKSSEYVKIDLYNKQGQKSATKYVEIADLESNATKEYQVKFKANNIGSYDVAIVDEIPDKSNIINIFGWEFDITDVFGRDLSNTTIFGVKLADLFTVDSAKTVAGNAWTWTVNLLKSIPWWGYAIGGGLILWYMPVGYLFGIFPV